MKNITSLKNNFRVSILHPVCSFSLFLSPSFPWLHETWTLAFSCSGRFTKPRMSAEKQGFLLVTVVVLPIETHCPQVSSVLRSGGDQGWSGWQGMLLTLQDTVSWHGLLGHSEDSDLHLTLPISIAVEKHKGHEAMLLLNTLRDWNNGYWIFHFGKMVGGVWKKNG